MALLIMLSSAAALVMKPTTAVRQPLRRVTRRTQPQMMAFLPISSIPMIGKARRTTKLSVAIDPFTEVENLPLQLLAKASAALVEVQLLASLDFPALIGSYNDALASKPFTTKAAGTGITYFFSDLTAQALEGDRSSLIEKIKPASQFFTSRCFPWVGPLLAAWFQVNGLLRARSQCRCRLEEDRQGPVLAGPFMGSDHVSTDGFSCWCWTIWRSRVETGLFARYVGQARSTSGKYGASGPAAWQMPPKLQRGHGENGVFRIAGHTWPWRWQPALRPTRARDFRAA